jgi:UrcA family protein
MKIALALAASILSLTTLDAQAAAPSDDGYSITVQFADLDLDRKAGIAKLYFRIKTAAQRVCDSQANERLAVKHTYAICVERAVSTAVARVNRPQLSEYVAQRAAKPTKSLPSSLAAR